MALKTLEVQDSLIQVLLETLRSLRDGSLAAITKSCIWFPALS